MACNHSPALTSIHQGYGGPDGRGYPNHSAAAQRCHCRPGKTIGDQSSEGTAPELTAGCQPCHRRFGASLRMSLVYLFGFARRRARRVLDAKGVFVSIVGEPVGATPTAEGARKAILNAAIKACWRFDPELQRWLCPDCVRARDASEVHADVARAALANAGHDTRAPQAWLRHRNIQHTVRYTELAPDRFKDFWRD